MNRKDHRDQPMHCIKIPDLIQLVRKFENKLNDPNDKDDKDWTQMWLEQYKKELNKKKKSLLNNIKSSDYIRDKINKSKRSKK